MMKKSNIIAFPTPKKKNKTIEQLEMALEQRTEAREQRSDVDQQRQYIIDMLWNNLDDE